MRILLLSVCIFSLALCMHLLIWRLRIPKRQRKVLLRIFLATFFISILGISIFQTWNLVPRFLRIYYFSEVIQVFIFVIAFAFSYIITYSAVEADSPSLAIIKTIAKSGSEGLDKGKLFAILNDDILVKPRLADLLTDGLVSLDNGRYTLTPKGRLSARVFIAYRKLLDLPVGG